MQIELELVDPDEQAFVDAANIVHNAAIELDADLAFMACATVMLDKLEFMIGNSDDSAYTLMLANQVHAEFLTLMADHGFDLSVDSVQ